MESVTNQDYNKSWTTKVKTKRWKMSKIAKIDYISLSVLMAQIAAAGKQKSNQFLNTKIVWNLQQGTLKKKIQRTHGKFLIWKQELEFLRNVK